MEKQNLLKELDKLLKEYNEARCSPTEKKQRERKFAVVDTVRDFLEKYLKEHPQDTDAWFKLALTSYVQKDVDNSIDCMKNILTYENTNGYALILLVYFMDYWLRIDNSLANRLVSFEITDKKIMSLVEFAKADYHLLGDTEMEKEALKKSIELCGEYVSNHRKLAELYLHEGNLKEAFPLIVKALMNVKRVVDAERDFLDFLSLERYINESFKETWITTTNYRRIAGMLERYIDRTSRQ